MRGQTSFAMPVPSSTRKWCAFSWRQRSWQRRPLALHDLQHRETKDHAPPAVRPDASGYVPKWISRDSLGAAVQFAEIRGSPVEAKLLTEFLRDLGSNGNAPPGSTGGTLNSLSPREL